jgi:predicted RNA binding protein YcfA (HicA-like mRNA interferase family)
LVVIPFHGGARDVPVGTLRRIIADMGLAVEEYNALV